MVRVKRLLRDESKKRTWRDVLLGSKDDIKIASDLIETKLITNGTYNWRDKWKLDRMYNAYRREIGLKPAKHLSRAFWNNVDKGREMALMAVERRTGRSLGFIKLVEEKAQYGTRFWLGDYYAVPKARKLEIASKLSKKAYMIARMKGVTVIESSMPRTKAGERTVERVNNRQKEWAGIPQDRFQSYGDYVAGLRKRKHFK